MNKLYTTPMADVQWPGIDVISTSGDQGYDFEFGFGDGSNIPED